MKIVKNKRLAQTNRSRPSSKAGSNGGPPAKGLTRSLAGVDPLRVFGDRVRQARARRGMTRKILARDSGVSERYLAQIESGKGNISILVLRELARALDIPLQTLIFEGPEPAVEFVHTVEFLRSLSVEDLQTARQLLREHFGAFDAAARHGRIALIGLRGAGKSTLGPLLAERLEMPFLELNQFIQQQSGLTLNLIFDFQGQSGYRRLERQCLERVLEQYPRFVLTTGGSLVSEPGTFELLLSSCMVVWLRATPEEHMQRVIAQGDMRPMADNRDAMADLRRILAEREALYCKADIQFETSGLSPEESVEPLLQALRDAPVRELEPTFVSGQS